MSEATQRDGDAGPTDSPARPPTAAHGIGFVIGLVPHRVDWVVCGEWIVGVPAYGYGWVPHPMPAGSDAGTPQADEGEGGQEPSKADSGDDAGDESPEADAGGDVRYVANTRSRETHSLADPCPYVDRMAERNRLLTDVRPDGYKWCDRCFPELADG